MDKNYTGIEKYDLLLESTLEPLINDKRIAGIAIAGSIASGDFSPYSDFDIIILHGMEHEEALKHELPDIAKSIPDYIIGDWYEIPKRDTFWFCLTKELVHVDYFRFNPDTLKPKHYFSNLIILKDNGILADTKVQSQKLPKAEILSTEEFVKMLLYLRTDFLYAPMKFCKGDRAEGIENVKYLFGELIKFKYKLNGISIWDHRKYEKILSEQELNDWKIITTIEPTASGLEMGLKLNWKIMKEIDQIYADEFNEVLYQEFDEIMWARIEELLQIARN